MKSVFVSALLLAASLPASAEIILTYSKNPNEASASPAETHVLTFSSLLANANKGAAWGVESFSQAFAATGSPVATELTAKGASHAQLGTGTLTSTLALAQDSSYFGMWWAAGDPDNVLKFYEGSELVGTFNTASLEGLLPESFFAYNGNGNGPSVFLNFLGAEGTAWDKIVLTDNNYSSQGSDNATTRVMVYNPLVDGVLPGLPVALVNGSTTSKVTTDSLTAFSLTGTNLNQGLSAVGAAPGAPAPPMTLLAAFAGVIALRQVRTKRREGKPRATV